MRFTLLEIWIIFRQKFASYFNQFNLSDVNITYTLIIISNVRISLPGKQENQGW